jgi:hypothetical protein
VGHYTKRRGGASRLGTSVAMHHSSSEPGCAVREVPPPLRVSALCVPVVVGEAVWKVDWGVLYVCVWVWVRLCWPVRRSGLCRRALRSAE